MKIAVTACRMFVALRSDSEYRDKLNTERKYITVFAIWVFFSYFWICTRYIIGLKRRKSISKMRFLVVQYMMEVNIFYQY